MSPAKIAAATNSTLTSSTATSSGVTSSAAMNPDPNGPVVTTPRATTMQSTGVRHIELDYPIFPRVRALRGSPGGKRILELLHASVARARELVEECARFRAEFERISVGPSSDAAAPFWINGWFPAFDAMMLYAFLVQRNPRYYVEVGSGNSTRFARRAIRDHRLRTQIISIDPCPRAEVDAICDRVIRQPLEAVDLEQWSVLTDEDLLFVDSSHRAFQGSDITMFFTEVVPGLPRGLAYGLHDIFLPNDYPEPWLDRFYSEQYLLAAYLNGGGGADSVLAPLAFLATETDVLRPLVPTFDELGLAPAERFGCAFWLKRDRS